MDDVTDFLSNHLNLDGARNAKCSQEGGGCLFQLKAFLDHMTLREHGNFKMRSEENKNSVTLTTMHQVTISLVFNVPLLKLKLINDEGVGYCCHAVQGLGMGYCFYCKSK